MDTDQLVAEVQALITGVNELLMPSSFDSSLLEMTFAFGSAVV